MKKALAFASTFSWRRWRDLNSRAGNPTYTLSRGAPSANLGTSPNKKQILWRRERDSNPRYLSVSLVFKTSAINRSAISPHRNQRK